MRQLMLLGFKRLVILTCLVLSASCGERKINSSEKSPFIINDSNYLLSENACTETVENPQALSYQIKEMYKQFLDEYPLSFFIIPAKNYDYKTPLVISQSSLEKSYEELKKKIMDKTLVEKSASELATELFYLHQNSARFEDQKCYFPALALKQVQDISPYMELQDFCLKKSGSGICTGETLEKLNSEEMAFVKQQTIKLCRVFDPSNVNCSRQYTIKQQNKTISSLVGHYQKRFESERFMKLFQLKEGHLKFECRKIDEVTQMNLKILSQGWDTEVLKKLLTHVAKVWSRDHFKVNLELVSEKGENVIEILPSSRGISYVPEDNNKLIYLSQEIDFSTQKRILAHEFGHVLGFPDCYTEYYDKKNKSLVYYEISKENNNLMCSMKDGVVVPEDYLDQLVESTCIFY